MGMLCILEYRSHAKEVRCEFTLHLADIKIFLHALATAQPIISFRNTFTFKEIVDDTAVGGRWMWELFGVRCVSRH